ncbi:hypothetical protein [Solilutibacter pythonis]|uniref:hypothetical protein n=1 Tax=Solilutibacter pythonis TaxID=2483112 RepID=UPI0011C4A15E|nr:hypothetical protein [Lysobacter pythonis]
MIVIGHGENQVLNEISLEESMRKCLIYFKSAVQLMLMSPEDIFEEFGAYAGAAWELRQELLLGKPLVVWGQLPNCERKLIEDIVNKVEEMPVKAFGGLGIEDLRNSSWLPVRNAAGKLLAEGINTSV